MGKRLTAICTRTGDDGTTGLGDGSRTAKNSLRIEALGAVDELNSFIGLLLAENLPEVIPSHLAEIQHDLFDLGAELSIPGHAVLTVEQILRLDRLLQELNGSLPALQEFILPGGSRAAALCHVVRTVCRHAERRCVALMRSESFSSISVQYLNRLSDVLFVMARALNQAAGQPEPMWKPVRNKSARKPDQG